MKTLLKGGSGMKRAAMFLGIPIVSYAAFVFVMYRYAPREADQALDSLAEPTFSPRFNSSFWVHERDDKSSVWMQALNSCERTMSAPVPRPNCSIVAVVANPTAQQELARELLAARRAAREWVEKSGSQELGNGLTGHGAQAGGLPTLKPEHNS
jgi:hypothetical protein